MSVDPKYFTEATATGGGRNGLAKLANGQLTVTMATPKELGGSGLGHNPEELFRAGLRCLLHGGDALCGTVRKAGHGARGCDS